MIKNCKQGTLSADREKNVHFVITDRYSVIGGIS